MVSLNIKPNNFSKWLKILILGTIFLFTSIPLFKYFKEKTYNKTFTKLRTIQTNLSNDLNNYFKTNIDSINNFLLNENIEINQISNEFIKKNILSKYEDILLISPEGNVKFSLKNEVQTNSNIYLKYKDSILTKLNDQVKTLIVPTISDIDYLNNLVFK